MPLPASEYGNGNDEELVKRATTSHSHNIMRFGRAGHNIMHFGKRGEESESDDNSLDARNSYNTESLEPYLYDAKPVNVGQRSLNNRYFIPHAFIASLYTHPRPFLKKAAESRDNVFMHFG